MNNNTIKYKNTNNDLEDIFPKNWNCKRIKQIFYEIDERSTSGKEDLLSVSQYTGVTLRKENREDQEYLTNAKSLKNYKIVRENDLIINIMLAWNGSLGISKYYGITSPAYCIYRTYDNFDPNFFGYLFSTNLYKNEFKKNSYGIIDSRLRMYSNNFFNITAFYPSLSAQKEIVNFLDKKCEQINQFIADKKQLINLLKEQRQSIVSNYVNSGCVENLSLKENPTIWLKESRSDWQFIKLKHLVELNKSSIDNAKKKNDLQKIALENIDNWTGKFLDGKKDAFEGQGVEFNKGDVLFNKLRPYLAKAIIAQNDGYCVGELLVLKPLQELITSEFLFFRLMTVEIIDYVNGSTYGAKMPRANWDFIGNIKIPLPSIDEQNIIVSKIKEETKTIDETIFKTEEELRLVAEYKEALISNAVTGQLHIA